MSSLRLTSCANERDWERDDLEFGLKVGEREGKGGLDQAIRKRSEPRSIAPLIP